MTAPVALNGSTPTTTERNVRAAAAGLVGAAAIWPLLPLHPPFVCPLRSITGVPCPLCGMTRACVAMAHAHVMGALRFNPGVVVVIAAVVIALVRPGVLLRLRLPLWLLITALGLLWVWNVGFNPTFHHYFLR